MVNEFLVQKAPFLIIAGTVKGGTTSLFSYLSKHDSISASVVKETCFFLPVRYGKERKALTEYGRFFQTKNGNPTYFMESTPGYLDGGSLVARDIATSLNKPKIVFVLRNPTERFISFFRYQKAQLNLPKNLSVSAYMKQCLETPYEQRRLQKNDAVWGIDGGFYVDYLPSWFDVFGKDNIQVVFFDDLVNSPSTVLGTLSEWLNLNPQGFECMNFEVENRTVPYQFALLHKWAIHFNKSLEPVMRRLPFVKKALRTMYYSINGGGEGETIDKGQMFYINKMYIEKNKRLAQFLQSQGYYKLPSWLKDAEG